MPEIEPPIAAIRGVRSMPLLAAEDVDALATWFRDRLGFALANSWSSDDGVTNFAIVASGTVTIGLHRKTVHHAVDAWGAPAWEAYVYVEDAGAVVAIAGDAVTEGPHDTFYGIREVEVALPDGRRIVFGQDLSPGPAGPGL